MDAAPRDAVVAAPADAEPLRDDTLELLFLCCHSALAPPSQMALTLHAMCGLTSLWDAAAIAAVHAEPPSAQDTGVASLLGDAGLG